MRSGNNLSRIQQLRRQDILQAAIAVLITEGYAAASVDRIAQQADTSKSTVLYHFQSKKALLQAVIADLYATGGASIEEAVAAAPTYAEKLRTYIIYNLRYIAEHSAQVAAAQIILANAPDKSAIIQQSSIMQSSLSSLLAAGKEAGEFGDFDPDVAASALRSIIDTVAYRITLQPSFDVGYYAGEITQLFIRSLIK